MLAKIRNRRPAHKRGQAVIDYALVTSLVLLAALVMVTVLSAATQVRLFQPIKNKLPADPAVF